jgi:phosphoserine phosphatase RsbU/P
MFWGWLRNRPGAADVKLCGLRVVCGSGKVFTLPRGSAGLRVVTDSTLVPLLAPGRSIPVTQPNSEYPRLVDVASESLPGADDGALLVRTCEAFERATGWTLEYLGNVDALKNPNLVWSAPVDPGVGASLGLIRPGFLPADGGGPRAVSLADVVPLAEVLAQLWGEISLLRQGLRSREAELAADIPVVGSRESAARTAERLEAILKAGAEAVGCQAAALYLLDSGTTSLKLRSCWGLPHAKLLEPPRELAGALADLEALLGHAVVLSGPEMNRFWHCPESSGASVCVPVSSPSTPLGTLWIFSDRPRDFSDPQTNMIEVIAGRLAGELEREVLLGDARQSQSQRREIVSAVERQTESLPRIAPLVDRWEVAGRIVATCQPDDDAHLAGAFFDWFAAADGLSALTLGAAGESGLAGALAAAQLRSALRAQADGLVAADRALRTAHEVLASLSADSQGASAFCALLPDGSRGADDEIRLSAAGNVHALVVAPSGCRPLVYPSDRLVEAAAADWSEIGTRLNPGELLLVYVAGSLDARWQDSGTAMELLGRQLAGLLPCDAEQLATAAADAIDRAACEAGAAADGALLVVRSL